VQKVKIMEDTHTNYNPVDEFKYLYVGLGVDGTKYKEERIKLVETINGLQKDVQSYKDDNEKFMRSKE